MRKIMIFAVLLLCCFCTPPMATIDDEKYQNMVEVNFKKEEIYNMTLKWMSETFKTHKDVIKYRDLAKGTIIGDAVVEVNPFTGSNGLEKFTMKIEIKDGGYLMTANNYSKGDSSDINNQWYHTLKAVQEVNAQIASIDSALYFYLIRNNNHPGAKP